jgi:hypothetical protein
VNLPSNAGKRRKSGELISSKRYRGSEAAVDDPGVHGAPECSADVTRLKDGFRTQLHCEPCVPSMCSWAGYDETTVLRLNDGKLEQTLKSTQTDHPTRCAE